MRFNIRDYAFNKHQKVDDLPYGGGAGMLMQAEPVYLAYESVQKKLGYRPRVVYLTPQGEVFHQTMAKELAKEKDLVFLCGHYEGIDERVLDEIVTDYVSIRRLCTYRRRTPGHGNDGFYFANGSRSFK